MIEIIHWPARLLKPATAMASPVAFSRSGGRSLGGIERTTRSDKGFWRVTLDAVAVYSPGHRRAWNAIRTSLNGKAGLVVVPAWSFDSAPYASGQRERPLLTTHDDGTTFDDGSEYWQGSVDIEMASYAPLSSTVVTLKLINAASAAGIRFSYQHALYETGPILSEAAENTFQVPVFPAIRQAIPAGSKLEADMPTVLCHLADDRAMDVSLNNTEIDTASVEFVEAVDFWNDLALEVA